MRETTEKLNKTTIIENIALILKVEGLLELPHFNTINNFLEKLDPEEIHKIIHAMVFRIVRNKVFVDSRLRGKWWQILIDGTGLYHFRERHCEKCLTKTHKDKNGKILWVDYYHYVLEAKLVFSNGIVISIGSEFVENDTLSEQADDGKSDEHFIPDVSMPEKMDCEQSSLPDTMESSEPSFDVKKQDCELKAFYRLAPKLKADFPKLPICLTMDSIYACQQVFTICRDYHWRFILRFKDGSIKTLAQEFHSLKHLEPDQCFCESADSIKRLYRFVTQMEYLDFKINAAECVDSSVKYPFVFITDLPLTRKNCAQFIVDGRRRWCIEDQGFDIQKNHGYYLEHKFSEHYTAMKNHYLLIQIGHALSQLLECATKLITDAKMSLENFHEQLRFDFSCKFSDDDLAFILLPCQIRFD